MLGGPNQSGLDNTPNTLSYPKSEYDNLKNGFPNE